MLRRLKYDNTESEQEDTRKRKAQNDLKRKSQSSKNFKYDLNPSFDNESPTRTYTALVNFIFYLFITKTFTLHFAAKR
jgi:hypothetical protein